MEHKQPKIITPLRVVAWISLVLGALFLIGAFADARDPSVMLYLGIAVSGIVGALLYFGFAAVIDGLYRVELTIAEAQPPRPAAGRPGPERPITDQDVDILARALRSGDTR